MGPRVVRGDAHGPTIELDRLVGPTQFLDGRSETQQRGHVVGVQPERLAEELGRLAMTAEPVQGAPHSGGRQRVPGPDPGRLAVSRQGVIDPFQIQEGASEIDVSIVVVGPGGDGLPEQGDGLGQRPARLLGSSAILQHVAQAEEVAAITGPESHQVAEDRDGLLALSPLPQGVGELVRGLRAEHPRGGVEADGLIPPRQLLERRARS